MNKEKLPKILLILFSFIGLIDSSYLTIKHFAGEVPFCAIGSCDVVLTSSFSEFLGIPISLLGVIFYGSIILLTFFLEKKLFLSMMVFVATLGILATMFFTYLQLYVIKSICMYCIVSAVSSVSIFLISIFLISNKKTYHNEHGEI